MVLPPRPRLPPQSALGARPRPLAPCRRRSAASRAPFRPPLATVAYSGPGPFRSRTVNLVICRASGLPLPARKRRAVARLQSVRTIVRRDGGAGGLGERHAWRRRGWPLGLGVGGRGVAGAATRPQTVRLTERERVSERGTLSRLSLSQTVAIVRPYPGSYGEAVPARRGVGSPGATAGWAAGARREFRDRTIYDEFLN